MQGATPILLAAIVCLGISHGAWAADGKAAAGSNAAATSKASVPHLTAAQIVGRNIGARGGLPAWHAVQALSWSGKMDAGSADSAARSKRFVQDNAAKNSKQAAASLAAPKDESGNEVQLPFTFAMERPRKSRLELVFAGKTAIQVYDGTSGWKVRPFLNRNDVEPFSAQETKSEAAKSDLDGPLIDYAAKGTRVELAGIESVEGHDAYKLKLTSKSGDVRHIWIDAQSFLDVKVEGSQRRMDGRMRSVWVYQRDFRTVQGIKIPFVLETSVDGYRDTQKIVIEKVTVNPKLDESLFGRPKA
jgi:outer membrane lipoprotein-sorting protein